MGNRKPRKHLAGDRENGAGENPSRPAELCDCTQKLSYINYLIYLIKVYLKSLIGDATQQEFFA
jgi:hypothetical protein